MKTMKRPDRTQAERVAAYRRRRRIVLLQRLFGLTRRPVPPKPRL